MSRLSGLADGWPEAGGHDHYFANVAGRGRPQAGQPRWLMLVVLLAGQFMALLDGMLLS